VVPQVGGEIGGEVAEGSGVRVGHEAWPGGERVEVLIINVSSGVVMVRGVDSSSSSSVSLIIAMDATVGLDLLEMCGEVLASTCEEKGVDGK
jgi:hypothetical protein